MSRVWFSTLLRYVVTVDDVQSRIARSVVVFLAEDFSDALNRAIEIGQSMESRYIGAVGDQVHRRLEEVETLDMPGDAITDGREVYAEFVDVSSDRGQRNLVDGPESSKPTQSGV